MWFSNMKETKIFLFVFVATFLFSSCAAEKPKFEFNGRIVLYSTQDQDENSLFLFNIDTNEKIRLNEFDNIEDTKFLLYNKGQNIFIDQPTSPFVIKFDLQSEAISKIYRGTQSHLLLNFFKPSIQHDTLYFANDSKIISYSIPDSRIIREYDTDANIYDFAVCDKNRIAVTHFYFENKTENVSNLVLYNFDNSQNKNILNERGILIKWSSDGKYLLYTKALLPYLIEYPSLTIKSLNGFNQDSIKVVGESFFIDNNTLIFPGRMKTISDSKTNLYLYDIQMDKILKQLTHNVNVKEIKSTSY